MKFQFKHQFSIASWELVGYNKLLDFVPNFPCSSSSYRSKDLDFDSKALAQVTAVDELGDVLPTDWAILL
jgi:hypothetical protein